ncbi:tRNA lysidine(34) synthetase TilS [Thiobacillus sp.]|uniref:tRNA lysidine(34) synthetase TilS n=1 Tax=Thiobacillus sp. TaxID=924 RepID=UPI0018293016|nr:tRNA lysidine(34) synthetase TilS [Thiobacillus sp.]MBC2731799.1 tRNA lysidine(34) synthetase TilS [Thiobacillus sp.]MBC2740537.1 tRNA lysidine(34) synthetase TilS [Thiobacillus sp.]MBC2758609.1 tRNA lysidine(34) synthetase TilS [Thiobacillus sp.]
MADVLGRHAPPHARLTLALSGGLDSVTLLHALLALRDFHPFELQAVHVHHGLSLHADDWADFCSRLCATHAVELAIHRVRIARADPAGIEAAARRERQRIFAALDTDFLLTAHHQDDQAETLLLQLLRGAGPKGLAAMAERQDRPGWHAAQLRPLLSIPRAELLRTAREQGLAWIDDESNRDTRYRRNALRQQVMPLLAQHFSGAGRTLARAAALQADAAELLDDLARLDAREAIAGDRLDCAALARLSTVRARNLLRHFIGQYGQPMPSLRRLDEALHQLRDAHEDARVRVNLGQIALWRYRGGAYLVAPPPRWTEPVRWQGEAAIWVPAAGVSVRMDRANGAGLRQAALAAGEVTLGVRAGGEHLRLHAGGPRRSLKNLLQEHRIPPWQRARMPLMWCDGRLVWAAGIGFEADLGAAPGEVGLLPHVEP